MVEFVHLRTGRKIEVGEGLADRYRASSRWTEPVDVPEGTVQEIIDWADTPSKRLAALKAEYVGKNRKSLIDALR